MQPLTVSLIQTKTHWHDPQANRDMFEGLLKDVPAQSQLVLLPEMFSTGFTMCSAEVAESMTGATVSWLLQQAQNYGQVLCGSLVVVEQGKFYNRFVAAYPDGKLVHYDKRHRFRMAGEHEHYESGAEKIVFYVAGWRVCPMVCYDLRFPVWFRNCDDYDLLICVANWPKQRQVAWNTLLRARAIENQAYCAAVNIIGTDGNGTQYGGGSGVYGPDGRVLAELTETGGGQSAQVITQILDGNSLQLLRQSFPVWQDADNFQLNS